ncbi:hypothetical protein Isop_3256 [Isosphaera pallida ATCC 43644]|uniref:Uncharacterized protein n=1 Tax=Isosphaera pallida (strain ATCC 43644 / DSM 9630 / IS1B) TaxID=575540 RepID=E8R565_ISOPI|nr:hypothetical protein [Isosphaera pallida]ADV63818.1 hypothetical protein Isop_3256 [Isosphaera pallida ATCC 43644]
MSHADKDFDPNVPKGESSQPSTEKPQSIKIFSYPKVIYLYPSAIVGLICGVLMIFRPDEEPPVPPTSAPAPVTAKAEDATETSETTKETPTTAAASTPRSKTRVGSYVNIVGSVFMLVLGINLVIMSLDFPRFTIFGGLFLGTTIVLLLILLGEQYDLISFFSLIFGKLYIEANATFYFVFSSILIFIFIIVYFARYLDYWEIRPNEILHHHGPFSDLDRYPTLYFSFSKEIPDILEFMMAGSGRLVLKIQGEDRLIVLENVLQINKKEEELKQLLSRLQVDK